MKRYEDFKFDGLFFNLIYCGFFIFRGIYLLLVFIISFYSENQVFNKRLEFKVFLFLNFQFIFNKFDFFILKEKIFSNKIILRKFKFVYI